MKFFLLLAVFVAASFAAPNIPTTFFAQTELDITISGTHQSKITGKGTLAEDNDNQKKLSCITPSGGSVTECELIDYHAKTLYVYAKDAASGNIINCTSHPLPANASTYENSWVWVPESTDIGSTTIDTCSGGAGETWELNVKNVVDLKVALDSSSKPIATDYKIYNSTGSTEEVTCFSSFDTTVDPSVLTPPSSCKPGLTGSTKKGNIFLFHGV